MNFLDFNNRDFVSLVFIVLVLLWAMPKKEFRASLFSLFEVALQPKIDLPVILMLTYNLLIVLIFSHFQLWDISLLKDTIYWLGAAFIMLLNFEKVSEDFKKQFIESIKWVVVLEFLVGLYAFSVWGEIILIPAMFLLSAFSIIAGAKKETLPVKRFSDRIIGLIGLYLLFFVSWNISHNFQSFWTLHNLEVFLLPIVFTLCCLPFIYLIAVWAAYDSLSIFLSQIWLRDKPELASFAKRKIFSICWFSLRKIKRISKRGAFAFIDVKTKSDLSNKLLKLMRAENG